MGRTTVLLGLLFTSVAASAQQKGGLMFNEVMQSNIDYLLVENDFPDSWVELYNPTEEAISLGGYKISEHADGRNAYTFPSSVGKVPAKGHLVIYCDKENNGLHTSFRIDSGNASLYLFNGSGEVVDSLSLEKMPAPNVAYGRVKDGAEEWQYEVTPTAGSENASVGSDLLLPAPEFSVPGGLFKDAFSLTISLPEVEGLPEDAKIYITTDGTEPTTASRAITKSQTFMVSRTMVIRAKVMSASALSPVSTVQSYIFHPRDIAIPVVSLVTPDAYIFGNEMGIASGAVNNGKPNYMQKWRRPINIEYYDMRDGGKSSFNQLGETAVSGVSTREQPQKSFKVYANKRFGKKTYKGDFWTDKPEVNKVKSFVLRSGGNNSFTTRINDALVQRVFGTHVDNLDWQAYQPVVVYINGIYRGEFGMRERSNEDFVEANYGLEEVEVADEASYQKPEAGSLFADFRKTYQSRSASFADLDGMMDMDNFNKVLMAEMYAMNTDFPTNNVAMWRQLEPAEDPQAPGTKWRWILKDLDRAGMNIALYPFSFDMFNYLFNPDDLMYSGMYHFDLYKKMAALPEFTSSFLDQFLVYLGDFLKPELVNAMADSLSDDIYEELKYTFAAYNCNTEWSKYKQNLNNLKQFFSGRPDYLYAQMASFFGLGNVYKMKVANSTDSVSVNDVLLTEGDFRGACFATRPVKLNSGNALQGWKLKVLPRDGEPTEHVFQTSEVTFLPTDYALAPTDTLALETWMMDVIDGDENEDEDENENGGEGGEDNPDNPGNTDDTGSEDGDNPGTGNEGEDNPADAIRSTSTHSAATYYTLTGARKQKLTKGFYIIRKAGKTEKRIVK